MKICAVLFTVILLSPDCQATIITPVTLPGFLFDFEAQSDVATIVGGPLDGLEITVESLVDGLPTGEVNASTSSLGVNAPGGGDDPDQLDGDEGLETLVFSFSEVPSIPTLRLTEIDLVGFGADDSGTISISGGGTGSLSSLTSTVIPGHDNLEGNSLTVAFATGNGFGIESLTFSVVPEPGSFVFCGLALCLVLAVRYRRRPTERCKESAA